MSVRVVHDAILHYFKNHEDFIAEFGANEIKKGSIKNENITEVGKIFRMIYLQSWDCPDEQQSLSRYNVFVKYIFKIVMCFYEPVSETAEDRKAHYDKMLRDAVDQDLSLGGSVIETTKLGVISFAEAIEVEGLYYGKVDLVVEKEEIAKNR